MGKFLDDEVDVINLSLGETGTENSCTIHANAPLITQLDAAYADGIVITAGVGNFNGPAASACKMLRPASYPSTLAITGVNASGVSSYHGTAGIDTQSSGRGGGTAVLNGSSCQGCYSLTGLAAPSHLTWPKSPSGSSYVYRGSSYATPVVTGAALSVKDQFLDDGNSWVNNPGRLHTIMLAMGDRRPSVHGSSSSAGADELWGFGRLRLRLFDSGGGLGYHGWSMRTYSWTSSSSSKSYVPWSSPLPANVDFVKCVTMADESFRFNDSSDQMSDIVTDLTIRSPVSGQCSASSTGYYTGATDWSYDYQDMVAVEYSQAGGKCAVVELKKYHVPDDGIVTHTFCYYAEKKDYE